MNTLRIPVRFVFGDNTDNRLRIADPNLANHENVEEPSRMKRDWLPEGTFIVDFLDGFGEGKNVILLSDGHIYKIGGKNDRLKRFANQPDIHIIRIISSGLRDFLMLGEDRRSLYDTHRIPIGQPGPSSNIRPRPKDFDNPILISIGLQEDEWIVDMAVGLFMLGFVTSTERLLIWGVDAYLGIGSNGTVNHGRFASPDLRNVVKLAMGDLHSVCIADHVYVYSFGDNGKGQCGTGDANRAFYWAPTRVKIPETVKQISSGDDYCMCITIGGVLYGWGLNSRGRLGIDRRPHIAYTPTIILPPLQRRNAKWERVECGNKATLGIVYYEDDDSLRMATWGRFGVRRHGSDRSHVPQLGGGHNNFELKDVLSRFNVNTQELRMGVNEHDAWVSFTEKKIPEMPFQERDEDEVEERVQQLKEMGLMDRMTRLGQRFSHLSSSRFMPAKTLFSL